VLRRNVKNGSLVALNVFGEKIVGGEEGRNASNQS
jgi:hypothetical protein